jgi:hypothetical protein
MTFFERNRVSAAASYVSGTASRVGSIVDARGYDGVAFVTTLHAVAGSGAALKVQGGNAADQSDMADLEGVSISLLPAHAGWVMTMDIIKPTTRYLRLAVTKNGADVVAESASVVRYKGTSEPVQNVSGSGSYQVGYRSPVAA